MYVYTPVLINSYRLNKNIDIDLAKCVGTKSSFKEIHIIFLNIMI